MTELNPLPSEEKVPAKEKAWASRAFSRFLSFSLRTKLMTGILSVTALALLVYGVISIYRTQQSQTYWSTQLQTNVQQSSQREITNLVQSEADIAEHALAKVTYAIQQLADYRATLSAKQFYLGQGGYWDGNSKLVKQPAGQYGNAKSDIASVFIPNTATISPPLIAELNTSMYLDFSAPTVLKENPSIVAIYYTTDNYSVYYPNVDLVSIIPPDFDLTTAPFYSVATSTNDPEHKPVWTAPYQDPVGTGLIVTNSIPVYDQNNQFRGVMSADLQLSKITEQISAVKLGQSGFAFLIDQSGHIIAMPDVGYKLFGLQPEVVPVGESPKTTLLGVGAADFQGITKKMVNGEKGLATATVQNTQYYVAYSPLPTIGYSIGLIAPSAELDAAYLAAREKIGQETRFTTTLSILILLVVLLAVGGVSLFFGRLITIPLVELTKTAAEVSKGNLNVKAEVRSTDEIGSLAANFNTMTDRLRETLEGLENRVAERTQKLERRNLDLALATQVSQTVSQVRDLDVMLKDAAEIILKSFGLYYVQVYLLDPNQTELVLQSGTGSVGAELVGRGHHLPLNDTSLNGRAAITKRSVVIPDTTTSAAFRPNPLLPNTRSEMVVPLLVGGNLVGVLDLQSDQPNLLDEDALVAFEPLSGQLAIAIQNAKLIAEMERARAEVEALARRLTRTGWEEYLDAIHQPEQMGFTFANDQVTPLMKAEQPEPAAGEIALTAPLAVTGEPLGALMVEIDQQRISPRTTELVNTIARQVSQQIENLRLLDSAERFRAEAEQASRRLTREGWQNFLQGQTSEKLGYMYNLNEVKPHASEIDTPAVTLPLTVHDETVGKLAVMDLKSNDTEALQLANAVAERLSAHIENLRLSEQTQERAQREQALRQITSAVRGSTDPATILRTAVRELGNLLGRKTIIRLETAREAGASPSHPTDLVGDSAANNGGEAAPPFESLNAVGGDE